VPSSRKGVKKLEGAIRHMVEKHQALDQSQSQEDWLEAEKKQIEKLQRHSEKIETWLAQNEEDKRGPTGGIRKSNLTDPDSAKMKCSRGIIQGYDGVAAVDAKHQVIVEAQVYGQPREHELLKPMVEGVRETFWRNGYGKDIFAEENIKLTADAGFHTAEKMQWLEEQSIDAYVADGLFRKRDPRFQDAERHKPDKPKPKRFTRDDFGYDRQRLTCRCPVGKPLYLKNRNFQIDGHKAIAFMGRQSDCGPCALRSRCLKDPNQILQARYVQTESIVMSKLSDEKCIIVNFINKTVFVVYSPRPVARQGMFQRFRLANSFKRRTLNVLNEQIDPFQ
jgi:hypothetical protein